MSKVEKLKAAVTKLKTFIQKFEEENPEPKKDEVVLAEAELEDGTKIKATPAIAKDATVVVVTAEGEVPAPDGTHMLKDGSSIVVEKGIILEVVAKKEEDKPEADAEFKKQLTEALGKIDTINKAVSSLETKFTETKKENDSLKEKLSESQKIQKEMFAVIEEMAELPAHEPVKKLDNPIVEEDKFESVAKSLAAIRVAMRKQK
jgi:flagellar hook-basal body complex protein FliE